MGKNKFLDAISAAPVVEPDEIDREMLSEMDAEPDREYVSKEHYEKSRSYNGNISLSVPKDLHRELVETAKEQGLAQQKDHPA